MVDGWIEQVRRWAVSQPFVRRLAGELPNGTITPGNVESRFMRLHAAGRFNEMWEMLAEDAQRAWGGRDIFAREMPRLDEWLEIVEMRVVSVKILPVWNDLVHSRTYVNVAQLVMRYHVRQQWRDWAFDREVHLVPEGAGGWRTLCYPMRIARSAYSTGGALSR